jgi:hypothetical protein
MPYKDPAVRRARRKTYPGYQRDLDRARERKESYRGICEKCGASTSCCDGPGKAKALCITCSNRKANKARRGTGPMSGAIVAYCAGQPRRYTEIRDHFGISKGHTSVAVNRLVKYGLLERVSRGVYRKAAA